MEGYTMPTSPRYLRVRIFGRPDDARRFLQKHPAEPECVKAEPGHVSFQLTLREDVAQRLEGFKLRHEVLYDASERALIRHRETGTGNRFEGGRLPGGLHRRS